MMEKLLADVKIETSRDNYPLALIVDLFRTLNGQGISYCHWKSNGNLDRTMRGLTDLDVLVGRTHGSRFREVLSLHGFKPMLSHPLRQYPAMEDYLGFDRDTGRLVHLHVHYQLILGEQFVKNYHLPLEKAYLSCSHTYADVKLPSPELETIVLVIRVLLKYRDRDFIKSFLPGRSRGLPATVLKEFEYLLDRTTPEDISKALESHFGFLPPDIVPEFLETLKTDARTGFERLRLRRRLRRELAPFQRYSRWRAVTRYFRGASSSRHRGFFRRSSPPKKTMMSGGLTVAVIGADGAGKSTLVTELRKWLSWRLSVRTYYMGSQQPSTITKIIGLGARTINYAYRACRAVTGEKNFLSRLLFRSARLLRYLHLIAIGKDRYDRYLAGQRHASQGALVIYDRYPLEAIHMHAPFMDGPRIAFTHAEEMGALVTALSEMEQNIYRKIRPPDHLLVLRVSPSVSLQRKPDHKRDKVEIKSQAVNQLERKGLCLTGIDADQPLDRVLPQAKAALWDLL